MLEQSFDSLLSSSSEDLCIGKRPDGQEMTAEEIIVEIDSCFRAGAMSTAEELFRILIEKNPEKAEYPMKLGHLMFKLKKYSVAERYYKDALENASDSQRPEIYFGLGQVYFETLMYTDSFLAFSLLLEAAPNYKFANFVQLKLGIILTSLGDYNSAVSYLIKIISNKNEKKSLKAEALNAMAKSYELQGRLELSKSLYKKAKKYKLIAEHQRRPRKPE